MVEAEDSPVQSPPVDTPVTMKSAMNGKQFYMDGLVEKYGPAIRHAMEHIHVNGVVWATHVMVHPLAKEGKLVIINGHV